MNRTHAALLCGAVLLSIAGLVAARGAVKVEVDEPPPSVPAATKSEPPRPLTAVPAPVSFDAQATRSAAGERFQTAGGPSGSASPAIEQLESAIAAVQQARAVILNNLANANTASFKRSRVLFEDLHYEQIRLPGQVDGLSRPTTVGYSVGQGVHIAATQVDYRQGRLRETRQKLDVAIVGHGFFTVNDGSMNVYTRSGNFSLDGDGNIVLASAERGRPLEPAISIPRDATDITITSDGIVSVLQPGQTTLNQVGVIQLTRFVNPQGLVQKGENLYQDIGAAGNPIMSSPGQDGLGMVRQRFLEDSNVDPRAELADLRRLQRHLDALTQAVDVLRAPCLQ